MDERPGSSASIERIENLSIVSLKVSRTCIDSARDRLQLAMSGSATSDDPQSLWIGPDRWLLVSHSSKPDAIVRTCNESLGEILHNAVDYSDGLAVFRISGSNVRQVLASGSGVDFRTHKFPLDMCCRTRFAHIAVVVVAVTAVQFDIYVDRGYAKYLHDWLADT